MPLTVKSQDNASPLGVLLSAVALTFASVGALYSRLLRASIPDTRIAIWRKANGDFEFYDEDDADEFNRVGVDGEVIELTASLPQGNSKSYLFNGAVLAMGDAAADITLNGDSEITIEQLVNAWARGKVITATDFPNDGAAFDEECILIDQGEGKVWIGNPDAMHLNVAAGRMFAKLGADGGFFE